MSQEDITTTEDQESQTEETQTQTDDQESSQGTQITDLVALQKELDDARKEAAKHRTGRNEEKQRAEALEQQVKAISKALGLESDDADPDALLKKLSDVESELRRERMTNHFTKVASAAEADVDLLLAYMTYHGELDDLDPSESDFEKELKKRIEAAVKANPRLKLTNGPDQSGDDFGKTSKAPQSNPWKKENRNLTEQGRIMREDPDLAAQLKREAGVS